MQWQCEFECECGGGSRAAGLIPCPFSMSFGIGDFEGHGEGVMSVGGAIYSLRKQFEDEGAALPLGSRSLSIWQFI